jgi:hypothetical protein
VSRIPGGRGLRRGEVSSQKVNHEESIDFRRRLGDLDLRIKRLEAYSYEDLRFPAQGINPPGALSDPARNSTTSLLEFSGTADNIIAGVAQMPHGWLEESPCAPHLHLRFPTSAAANSRWRFEWDAAPILGNFTSAYGSYANTSTITVANPQNTAYHGLYSFGEMDMTGLGFSSVVMWRITRLAASDAADTDINAIVLLEFDIHYLNYRLGHNLSPEVPRRA